MMGHYMSVVRDSETESSVSQTSFMTDALSPGEGLLRVLKAVHSSTWQKVSSARTFHHADGAATSIKTLISKSNAASAQSVRRKKRERCAAQAYRGDELHGMMPKGLAGRGNQCRGQTPFTASISLVWLSPPDDRMAAAGGIGFQRTKSVARPRLRAA